MGRIRRKRIMSVSSFIVFTGCRLVRLGYSLQEFLEAAFTAAVCLKSVGYVYEHYFGAAAGRQERPVEPVCLAAAATHLHAVYGMP